LKFDLTDLNPGTWFTMEDGGRVSLRICAGEDYRGIRKQVTKKRVEFKNGQRYEFQETNEDLLSELLWDFCITGWENFFDSKMDPIPCTKENKVLLMGRSIKFSNFVSSCLDQLTESQKVRAEDLEKN
jgi:hypothetical protein